MRGVSGHAVRHALIAGIERVQGRREELDRINVFPVADGDTGTNLAFTLAAVVDAVRDAAEASAGLCLRRAAEAALDGARGNSGTLIAQFAQGVSESVGDAPRLDLPALARAASNGARSARDAVAEPREGTMLSVFAAFAAALDRAAASSATGFREGFTLGLERAREALARTPEQLAVLRDAGVVDAGASGFVEMLEGISAYWHSGRRVHAARPAPGVIAEMREATPRGTAHFAPDSPQKYCTECLISGAGLDRVSIRQTLSRLPLSSLVVAGSDTRVRVHAHIDAPGELFRAAEAFGDVSGHKADDMHAQAASMASDQAVAIVVDGGADVPMAIADRQGLHWVPVRVSFGTRDYVDRVSLTPPEFYALMRSGEQPPPRTSQPPPGDFVRVFEYLTAHGHDVVYVGLSRAVSGTLQAGESAASRVRSEQRIAAIDTRCASVAQGLVAIDAAEAAARGCDLNAVVARVETMRMRTRLFALIADPAYGIRGGRAPKLAGPLTRWLRVRLIIGMNARGRMALSGVLWGNTRLAQRFAAWLGRRCRGDARWRINIGHCDDPGGASQLAEALRSHIPSIDACWTGDAGTAIGAHAGPGALIVGVQECLDLPAVVGRGSGARQERSS